jgi:tRNA/tmRNA/rRNA uracil-C5-methylase (TrmA/RlmC/RlmD family)
VEIVPDASRDARKNAERNGYQVPNEVITRENFALIDGFRAEVSQSGNKGDTLFYPCNIPAEIFLAKYLEKGMKADLLIVDPPRDGMHPSTPPSLVQF